MYMALKHLHMTFAGLSIGLFVSSRSDNQIVSLIVTVVVCAVFYLIGSETLTALVRVLGERDPTAAARFADQLRDRGLDVREAIERGAARRFRPVVMTLMSTILGALPLILSTGAGSEARSAIGWVVFGGLALAAVFTLYLTPALYSLLAPLSKARAAEGSRLQDELDHAISIEEASVR